MTARHRNLCVVGDPDQSIYKWRGADLRNILDFERDYPEAVVVKLERNYRSTQVILDAASAVIAQNRNRKEKRLYTDTPGGQKVQLYRAADDLDEAEFIARTCRRAVRGDGSGQAAVLYRTNAQSRTIEDGLRRANIAYKIIGGVRFYERKEIKDTLAYLRLALNPHDDVSLRRVINVPARGIGKGVMDALEAVAPGSAESPANPLFAGLQESGPPSLWSKLERAVDERLVAPRAGTALGGFRNLVLELAQIAREDPWRSASARCWTESGYLKDLREEHSEEAEGRIENLAELVSAAREYESRTPEPSLAGFVDQLSLLSDADEESGAKNPLRADDDPAQRQGARVPDRHHLAASRKGSFRIRGPWTTTRSWRRSGGSATSGLTRAQKQVVLTSAARRRVFGDYQSTEPSRFIDEIPPNWWTRRRRVRSRCRRDTGRGQRATATTARARFRRQPPAPEPTPSYAYEDEDQSVAAGPQGRACA